MKRFLVTLVVLFLSILVGAAALGGGMYLFKFDPFAWREPREEPGKVALAALRQTCATDANLKGSTVKSVDLVNSMLIVRGWVAKAEQKPVLEAKAKAMLEADPALQEKCARGVSVAGVNVFDQEELLAKLRQDFAEGAGKDTAQRFVMRSTRLDGISFNDDGKLVVAGVCIRGLAQKDASNEIIRQLVRAQLDAAGLAEWTPDFVLDIRHATSPVLIVQKQLPREDGGRDPRLTAARYDAKGKLHLDGLLAREVQRNKVETALASLQKDLQTASILRASDSAELHLTVFDTDKAVRDYQKALVELGRKDKTELQRIRLTDIELAIIQTHKEASEDELPMYAFKVHGRHLDTAKERLRVQPEVATWLTKQIPSVTNADQSPIPVRLEFVGRDSPIFALQERLVERNLDGAVFTDALFDEEGKLELHGRVHQPDAGAAIDDAVKDLLKDHEPWTVATLKPHEARKDGSAMAWKDVLQATQGALAKGAAGRRQRVDRLTFRYKDGLKLEAKGAYLSEGGAELPGRVLSIALDEIIATRSGAAVTVADVAMHKNPLADLQNALAEHPELDGVLLTQMRYNKDGELALDGFFAQEEQKNPLKPFIADRVKALVTTERGLSIETLKAHKTAKDEKWQDVVRSAQSGLASSSAELRRTYVDRLYFQYDPSRKLALALKGIYLARPSEKPVEPAIAKKVGEACNPLLPDVAFENGEPMLVKFESPIFELQKLVVGSGLDGLLFADAYYLRDGKLAFDGLRGSDEQLAEAKKLLDGYFADKEKARMAPRGLAPLDFRNVAWQPLLAELRAQLAGSPQAFHRQTRLDRIFLENDAKGATIRVAGISIYKGKSPAEDERPGLLAALVQKHLEAKGVTGFAVSAAGIERKDNPAAAMQERAIEAGMDGVAFSNVGFDAKGACYIRLPLMPEGQEPAIRKLVDEFSRSHSHLKGIALQ